jgi:hypothetical protein
MTDPEKPESNVVAIRWLIHKVEIVMLLPQPVDNLSFTPDQARDVAGSLLKFAAQTDPPGKKN